MMRKTFKTGDERIKLLQEELKILKKKQRKLQAEVNKLFARKEYEEQVESGLEDDAKAAFENAIKKGMRHPTEWTYIYSENGWDFFKHCFGRMTTSFANDSMIERGIGEEKKRIEIAKEYKKV